MVQQTTFEKLDTSASILGFGCMRFPCKENGKIDEQKTFDMVDYAYAQGVNYFDTAYMYHDGQSQVVIGNALKKYPRESFYLTNKMPIWMCETPEDVDRIFQDQLDKCQVNYFDFYLIHALDSEKFEKVIAFEVYEKLKQKQKEGKIKHLGFSFHGDLKALNTIVGTYEFDFVQLQINYVDYALGDAKEFYEVAVRKNLPIIIMEPVRGGFLANLPESVSTLFTSFDDKKSVASWALRWVAGLPNVKVILSGMSNMEQVEDNISIFSNDYLLSEQEYRVVDQAVECLFSIKTIPCTSCKYCIECPSTIDIPYIFEIFNQYKLFGDKELAKAKYNAIVASKKVDACIMCNACVCVCPQQIAIPEQLKNVERALFED